MTNLKPGDVLTHKKTGDEHIILAIRDGLYAVSYNRNRNIVLDECTLEGLKEYFVIPEERWVPVQGEEYFIITNDGKAEHRFWSNGKNDLTRYEFGNVFQSKKEALAAYERVKNALAE